MPFELIFPSVNCNSHPTCKFYFRLPYRIETDLDCPSLIICLQENTIENRYNKLNIKLNLKQLKCAEDRRGLLDKKLAF